MIGQTTEDTCVLNTRDFFFSLPDVLACVRMNECAGFHVVLRAYDSTQRPPRHLRSGDGALRRDDGLIEQQ